MRYHWMRKILRADQRQKQNHKEKNLLTQEEDLLQRCKERIEKLTQQDKLSKFCVDADS